MKIIWIRHGTVDLNSQGADTLTRSGKRLAEKLPKLLRDNGIKPEVIFYDASDKSKKKIERCKETISGFPDSVEKVPYNYNYIRFIFERCKTINQAAICYTSESLKYFPKIQEAECEKYMGNPKLKKPCERIRNKLYENIIISEYDGNEIRQVCTIVTGDSRTKP